MKKQCLKNYFIITLLSLGLILQSCGNIFQKTTLNGNNQISQKSFPISDNTDRFKNTYLSENVSPEKKAFRTWAVGCNQNLMVSRYLINPKSTDSTKNKVTITGSVKMDAVNGSGTNGNQVKLIINGVVETPIIALTTNTDCPSFGYFTYDWDGRDLNGNVLPDGTYPLEVLRVNTNETEANPIRTEPNGLWNTVKISSDPLLFAQQQLFYPKDLTDLLSKLDFIKLPDNDAVNLYETIKSLAVIEEKIASLTTRNDVTKLADVNSEKTALLNRKTQQISSLQSSINEQNNLKEQLRSYLNQVTYTASLSTKYSQDYDPQSKPDSAYSYDYEVGAYQYDFESEDEVNEIYISYVLPNFVNGAKAGKKIEKIDSQRLLTLANLFSDEIKMSSDLIQDISSNSFTGSELETASDSLAKLCKNINKQKISLINRTTFTRTKLENFYKTFLQSIKDTKDAIGGLLANIVNNKASYEKTPFATQSLKSFVEENNDIEKLDFHTLTVQDYVNTTFDYLINYEALLNTYNQGSVISKEFITRNFYGLNEEQWVNLDTNAKNEYIAGTSSTIFTLTLPVSLITGIPIGFPDEIIAAYTDPAYIFLTHSLMMHKTLNGAIERQLLSQEKTAITKVKMSFQDRIKATFRKFKKPQVKTAIKCAFGVNSFSTKANGCNFNWNDLPSTLQDKLKNLINTKINGAKLFNKNFAAKYGGTHFFVEDLKTLGTQLERDIYFKKIFNDSINNLSIKGLNTKDNIIIIAKLNYSKVSKFCKIDSNNFKRLIPKVLDNNGTNITSDIEAIISQEFRFNSTTNTFDTIISGTARGKLDFDGIAVDFAKGDYHISGTNYNIGTFSKKKFNRNSSEYQDFSSYFGKFFTENYTNNNNQWKEPWKGLMGNTSTITETGTRLRSLGFSAHHYLNMTDIHLVVAGVHNPLQHYGGVAARIKIGEVANRNIEDVNRYLTEKNISNITEDDLDNILLGYFKSTFPQGPVI